MSKTKIAIACQGGGSHTAFTAGALKHLLAESVHKNYDLVGLTGTSGGAICATAVWYGLARAANGAEEPPYKALIDFWMANSPQTPVEQDYFRPEKVGQFKPITVRMIRMSKPLSDTLTYSTKLKRDTDFIEKLIQDGEAQAAKFLVELEPLELAASV